MKVDRRSFLSFAVGGAAGTMLSPLPWKMMDDVSIWSQMWPWTPVPEDGEVTHVNSVCTLCPGACGITVRKVNERAVKIEGMAGYPINDGGICTLGLSGLQLLYGPTRVKSPLKRVGQRGDGHWQKISWAVAIDELGRGLSILQKKGNPQGLAAICGSARGTQARLLERLLAALGSPNYMRMPSMQDSYELALQRLHQDNVRSGFDFENADFILSFGSGILDGWGSPVRMFQANSGWKDKKVSVVQVEPRQSITAAKMDHWLAIKPGTEAALALGLIHTVIDRGLYDKAFVSRQGSGFDAFEKMVRASFNPDQVADITGLDLSLIISLGKKFGEAAHPIAVCGRGQGTTPGAVAEFMAVHALNALKGTLNRSGGAYTVPAPGYIDWPALKTQAQAVARADGAGSESYPDAGSLLNRFIAAGGSEAAAEILLVSEANPCYSLPDTPAVKKAFDKIPMVVSFSSWMDETAQNADLILPSHMYLESFRDVAENAGMPQALIGLAQPVVHPQFNTRYTGDVAITLAKKLGGDVAAAFPWADYESCLEATLGSKWGPLLKKTYIVDPDAKLKPADVKLDFAAIPPAKPITPEGDKGTYPLLLVPYDSMRLAHGYIGSPPFVVKTVEETVLKCNDGFVEINPQTAKEYRLKEGKFATLTTPKGKAKVRVHLSEGIMPGLVALPRGLGHTAYDKFLAGKGVNFNDLIGSVEDPHSGLDAAWGIRAKLA